MLGFHCNLNKRGHCGLEKIPATEWEKKKKNTLQQLNLYMQISCLQVQTFACIICIYSNGICIATGAKSVWRLDSYFCPG